MKKKTPRSNGTKKFVKRIVKESIAEVLATAPKSAWKSWPELWREYPKSGNEPCVPLSAGHKKPHNPLNSKNL